MGTHKICVAVNKRAAHKDRPCDRVWSAVCGFFLPGKVSTHPRDLRRCGSKFAEREKEQDKTRRRLRLRAVTAARSADRFQDFYGQEEGISELFGKFKRGSL